MQTHRNMWFLKRKNESSGVRKLSAWLDTYYLGMKELQHCNQLQMVKATGGI